MKIIQGIDTAITRVVNFSLVILFLGMAGLAIMQVFLRYFFNSGVMWADIAARNLVLWVGMLGGILATREVKHFHIDILTRFLSSRNQIWFRAFSDLFSAVICFFLGQASISFLALDTETRTFFNLPVVIIEVIIPIGFYLMMVQFLIRMILTLNEPHRNVPPSMQAGG
jgi:TRAP-type C4-dicarboxylate transport system permease small subunit